MKRAVALYQLALTAILLGYFLPWVPLEPAGLRLVGFEVGEWVKFLPQVQGGQTPDRNLFYLPPLTLALLLALLTPRWSAKRWQTWAVRSIAAAIALLALPALQIIRFEPAGEWRLRVVAVGMVMAGAFAVGILRRLPPLAPPLLVVLLGMVGAILPTYAFFGTRAAIGFWVNRPVPPGSGLVLNLLGHLAIAGVGIYLLQAHRSGAAPPPSQPKRDVQGGHPV